MEKLSDFNAKYITMFGDWKLLAQAQLIVCRFKPNEKEFIHIWKYITKHVSVK